MTNSNSSEIVEIQRSLRNLETKITNLDKFATRVDDWKDRSFFISLEFYYLKYELKNEPT